MSSQELVVTVREVITSVQEIVPQTCFFGGVFRRTRAGWLLILLPDFMIRKASHLLTVVLYLADKYESMSFHLTLGIKTEVSNNSFELNYLL